MRSSMSHSKVSEEFFKKYLPDKIRNIIDFDSLKLQKESYIDDNLKLQITDLLYAVNFDGHLGFLYILIEHASKSDSLLPFRMLKYMTAIMEDHLKDSKNRKLPLIYPLIFYTGKKPYAHSMDLFDLFAPEDQELAKETLLRPYHLIDLSQACDEEMKKYVWLGAMASALKHIHDPDILPFFDEEKIMTLADYLKPEIFKRGEAKGHEKGIKKGFEEGIKKGRKERDEVVFNIID